MADPCWACFPAQGSFLLAVLILLSSWAPSPQSTALALCCFLLGPLYPQVPVPTISTRAVLRATGDLMAISSPPARLITV